MDARCVECPRSASGYIFLCTQYSVLEDIKSLGITSSLGEVFSICLKNKYIQYPAVADLPSLYRV